MSDVVVSVVESNTNVTVTEPTVVVAITETPTTISTSTVGLQGIPGAKGDTGATGATGATGSQGPKGDTGATGATGATGVGYTGVTSTTSITIGSGLKTFTLVSGNQGAFVTGMRIRAIHSDTPTYFMEGAANYIGGGSLLITVDKFNGSGSHNSWFFAVAGEVGQTGATGATGADGASGVVSVVSPITNTGSASSAIIGITQSALSLTKSQISDFTSGTVASAGTAQQAGTAVYAATSGTATYATTSGTSVSISGSITKSQVSDFTSGTVASASVSGTASYATTSGTAVYATNSGSAVTSGTATYATSAGTVTGAAYTNATNTFTVGQIINNGTAASTALVLTAGTATNKVLVVRGASGQSVNLEEWQTSALGTAASISAIGGFTSASLTTSGTVTLSGSVASLITGGTAGTSGQVLTSAGAGASPTWSNVTASTAQTAGTAFYANTSGTAVAVSGSAITESQVVNLVSDLAAKQPLSYIYSLNSSVTNAFPSSSNALSVFGGTANPTFGFTVNADSTYEFEFVGRLSLAGATTTQTPTFSIGSTALTLSPTVGVNAQINYSTNTSAITSQAAVNSAYFTTTTALTAVTSTRYYTIFAKGIIRVTGTGTVKIYPALSATTSLDNVWTWGNATGFKLTYIGNGNAISVGTWS